MRVGRKTLIVTIVVAAAALAAVAVVPAIAAAGRSGAGPGWMMGGGGAGGVCQGTGPAVDEVATLLGMTPEQIVTERQAGKSLAQIAAAKNVEKATLIKTILDSHTAALDQAVEDGRITQAQADQMTTRMTERVTAMVDENGVGGRGGACFGAQDGDMPCQDGDEAIGTGQGAGYRGGMMGRGLGRGTGGGCCSGNGASAPTATANQI